MSNYAENNLTRGEIIEIKAKFSFLAAIGPIIWFIFMALIAGILFFAQVDAKEPTFLPCIIFIIIGLVPLLVRLLVLWCANLVITNKRVLGKNGIIRINSLDYPIAKIDNVSVKQGFWGSLLRFSTIEIRGPGGGDSSIKFKYIKNAREFKNHLTEAIEKHDAEARRAQAEEIARAMGK